jgi:hypothetical protein
MSLSNHKPGRLIAIIDGGKFDGRKIYLQTDDQIPHGQLPIKEFKLEESDGGRIVPVIDTNLRSILYIAGPSGSGKSTLAANWIYNAQKYYPEEKIYLFSPIEEDEVLDELEPLRADMENKDALVQLTKDDLADSFCVFDDCDSILDPITQKVIQRLQDMLLQTGRHTNTKMVITSHLITDLQKTRKVLNEATAVALYPTAGDSHNIERYLHNYMGIKKDMTERILSLKSRWCLISKSYPMYCLTKNEIFIMSR